MLAWDAAWTVLREQGDSAAVDPITAADAEMICGELERTGL